MQADGVDQGEVLVGETTPHRGGVVELRRPNWTNVEEGPVVDHRQELQCPDTIAPTAQG